MTQVKRFQGGSNGKKSAVIASSYQGPLPPPEMLHEYDHCFQGSAKLILEEFKKQGSHRRTVEKGIVFGKLYFGPLMALAAIGGAFRIGYLLFMNGKNIEGFTTFFGPLALIGALFVWNNWKSKDDN